MVNNMTIKELKEILDKYPNDTIVMFRHNIYSTVDIDEIDYKEEHLLSGKTLKRFILEASFEES